MQELIEFLREHGFQQMEEIELVDEDVRFSLPAELTDLDPMSAPLPESATSLESRGRSRRCAARRDYLAGLQAARRPLVRGTHRRHHARIRLHPVSALAVSAGERRLESADAGR